MYFSIENIEVPEKKGIVRGEESICWFLDDCKDGTTVCTGIFEMDPKGSIPKFFINMLTKLEIEGV